MIRNETTIGNISITVNYIPKKKGKSRINSFHQAGENNDVMILTSSDLDVTYSESCVRRSWFNFGCLRSSLYWAGWKGIPSAVGGDGVWVVPFVCVCV